MRKDCVCVTGASGGIGQALLEQLVDRYQVKALIRARSALSREWEQRGVTVVEGNLGDASSLSQLASGARFVFHCAALVTRASHQDAHAVNVDGTRLMALAASSAGCKRFIHVSSVAVYTGDGESADHREDAELAVQEGMAVYSATKLQAEYALREVAGQSGLEFTILRPTCVYGPNTKSYTEVPIELIRKGLPIIVGDGRGIMDAVYVDDVARALVLAADSPHAAGEVFNIGHETVTLNEFYSYFGTMLGLPVRHLPISIVNGILRLPAGVGEDLRKGARFLIRTAENTRPFPHSKATALLDYNPTSSLPVGMLKTQLWAQQQKLVSTPRYFVDCYGTLPFQPRAVVHPTCEEEIAQIVRVAADRHLTVKAIGSLHSQCPIPETDGITVVLDRYQKLLDVEDGLVTVQSGMKLKELNEELATRSLALPVNGSITAQTVSGAISTATHGGSIHHGSLSDSVHSVRLIRADGSILDIDRSHPAFPAAAASLGLLGIISTVTFRCRAAFLLESRSSVKSVPEALQEFDDIARTNQYVDMLYFGVTDQIEILMVNRTDNPVCKMPVKQDPVVTVGRRQVLSPKMRHGLTVAVLKVIAAIIRKALPIQRYFTRFSVGSSYRPCVDRSDKVLAFSDLGTTARSPMVLGDMEVAVPYEHARSAITAVRDHFAKTGKYPLLPVHIRTSPRSDLWLSPAYQREVCWLEFWQYPRTDSLFKEIHELLKPFHYRFHWGKETVADRHYIEQQYEKWGDFTRLREEWDPNGMFLNRYLESFFSKERSAAATQA